MPRYGGKLTAASWRLTALTRRCAPLFSVRRLVSWPLEQTWHALARRLVCSPARLSRCNALDAANFRVKRHCFFLFLPLFWTRRLARANSRQFYCFCLLAHTQHASTTVATSCARAHFRSRRCQPPDGGDFCRHSRACRTNLANNQRAHFAASSHLVRARAHADKRRFQQSRKPLFSRCLVLTTANLSDRRLFALRPSSFEAPNCEPRMYV